MQTEGSARVARLEQLLDEDVQQIAELQRENAELQAENAELRLAVRHVLRNSMDLLTGIKRQVENEEQRLEKLLSRPVTKGSKLVEMLVKERERELEQRG